MSKTYKLHLPPNIPEKNFWSFTVYDSQSRSLNPWYDKTWRPGEIELIE